MDFLLTPNGDLAFTESHRENKKLKINFYKTKSRALKVDFEMDTYLTYNPPKDSLTITFDINHIKNDKKAMMVKDDAYKIQQILMRIKTSLGELPERQEIGSKIETVMHKNLHSSSTISKVEQVVGDAIRGLVSNCTIIAKPYVKKESEYKQIMNVMIYQDEELLLTYEMEG